MRPQRWQPTRLFCPWDSPGKNTGVGCHFLLQCMRVKSESEVAQSCPTLRDPVDCSPPGSSVHGIFQARVLEWGASAFSGYTDDTTLIFSGFPCGSAGKESAYNVGDLDSIPGLGRYPGEGNGNSLQYSCLEKPMDRGASVQFSPVAQSCPTLCDPMNYSMPGLPVHHQLLESTQTCVHCVSDAIQSFYPLLSASPPALNLSQY